MSIIRQILKDETGATAIEYGLIAALIAVASIVAMQGFGDEFQRTMGSAEAGMASGNSGA